jgi:hypothetical protein
MSHVKALHMVIDVHPRSLFVSIAWHTTSARGCAISNGAGLKLKLKVAIQ